jgi:rRNA-processing protein EBP2
MRSNFSGFSDSKPGSTHERRSNSNKGGPQKNKNGSAFTMGKSMRGGAAAGRGGRGGSGGRGGRGGKPNRPGKSARASGRK